VIDARSGYVVFVKENHPTLLHDIEMAFVPSAQKAFSPSAATSPG
jgi:hypothetical protein